MTIATETDIDTIGALSFMDHDELLHNSRHSDVYIRVAQRIGGSAFLRFTWDPGIIHGYRLDKSSDGGVAWTLLEDKQYWEGRIVMSHF